MGSGVMAWTGTEQARNSRPAARRIGAGTPEVYFHKAIDNSRLVKVADGQRTREMRMFGTAVAMLFVLFMVYAWQHLSAIEYGYRIEAQKSERERLVETNRSLRLEEASLRSPDRIDMLAREMGLESPHAGQVVRMENTEAPSGAVMAAAISVIPATR